MTSLTGKRVKNPTKSAIPNSFEDFTDLLKEKKDKLHLKESLLIKFDETELNRNIYGHFLELFD